MKRAMATVLLLLSGLSYAVEGMAELDLTLPEGVYSSSRADNYAQSNVPPRYETEFVRPVAPTSRKALTQHRSKTNRLKQAVDVTAMEEVASITVRSPGPLYLIARGMVGTDRPLVEFNLDSTYGMGVRLGIVRVELEHTQPDEHRVTRSVSIRIRF